LIVAEAVAVTGGEITGGIDRVAGGAGGAEPVGAIIAVAGGGATVGPCQAIAGRIIGGGGGLPWSGGTGQPVQLVVLVLGSSCLDAGTLNGGGGCATTVPL
jgi:hypothetical protein